MLLNGIHSRIVLVICQTSQLDVQRILAEHREQEQIFQVICNGSILTAVKDELYTLIIDYKTRIELEHLTSFGNDDFATI
jgi:D-mannonate dehydratase